MIPRNKYTLVLLLATLPSSLLAGDYSSSSSSPPTLPPPANNGTINLQDYGQFSSAVNAMVRTKEQKLGFETMDVKQGKADSGGVNQGVANMGDTDYVATAMGPIAMSSTSLDAGGSAILAKATSAQSGNFNSGDLTNMKNTVTESTGQFSKCHIMRQGCAN